jgi:rhamnogalacturonan endolyase
MSRPASFAWLAASLLICLFAICSAGSAQSRPSMAGMRPETPVPSQPVTVTDDGTSFILSNGYLTATINKKTGDMTSLKVYGLETQGYVSGHHAGYWEQNPNGASRMESKVTIDPRTNGGKRVEVSIKGWSDGKNLNAGSSGPSTESPEGEVPASAQTAAQVQLPPGVQRNRGTSRAPRPGAASGASVTATGAAAAAPAGAAGRGLLVDMEIRYTLGRGEKGIYTYAIFTHEPSYGATQIGESRYGMKLNGSVFDWLSIDSQRNMAMPTGADWDKGTDLNMKEARRLTTGVKTGIAEHKYDYCADQFDTPAFGWSSTKKHVGIYFINPSVEFLSAGPNHYELTGHLDDGDGGDPTLLDYWRGSHYGGAILPLAAGEDWNKVVGPILIYVPSDATPAANFADAKRQAKVEADKWPYAWVDGVDYPKAAQRATVSGQLILRDTQAPPNSSTTLPHLLVGLSYPDQVPSTIQPGQPGGRAPELLTWQNDAKHYEFWTRGSSNGRFSIPNVRPGTYELHAVADGVLGEYSKASITIKAGGEVDLGKLVWGPVRYGKQLWQIGIPNRSASEFLRGDDHWHWGEYIEYAKLFPNDVNFTVGKSDFRKDWFIYQVPHDELANDLLGKGQGRATSWKVNFNLAQEPAPGEHGILRLAIAGASARSIAIEVNGKDAGSIDGLVYNATINRDGVEGSWVEKDLTFDASLLHAGENTLTLTVPAGGTTSGVAYDVVRLELASAQQAAR